ncbi:hypothetical protein DFH27DRAFT_605430 [Peziza echinospora]|nr:hypothetical protein DFH27DRAFT_605430 [Peziza echinospora]
MPSARTKRDIHTKTKTKAKNGTSVMGSAAPSFMERSDGPEANSPLLPLKPTKKALDESSHSNPPVDGHESTNLPPNPKETPDQKNPTSRPRRQAAMAAAQRIREWDGLKSDKDDYDEEGEENKNTLIDITEDTIICKHPSSSSANSNPNPNPNSNLNPMEVSKTGVDGAKENGDQPGSWRYTVDEDDDGDQDYEYEKGEVNEDDEFEMDESGDDASEVEEMGRRPRKRQGKSHAKKGKSLQNGQGGRRASGSRATQLSADRNGKSPQKLCMPKRGSSLEERQEQECGDRRKTQHPLGAMGLDDRSRDAEVGPTAWAERGDRTSVFQENRAYTTSNQIAPNSGANDEAIFNSDENAGNKHLSEMAKWERATADFSDDEPLFSNLGHKKKTGKRSSDSKIRKSRPQEKKKHGGAGAAGFGGPSETKFRRREIAAMLRSISKEVKWKDVAEDVGNPRRTAGSYASHWKNVLIKNILERYQDDA